MGIGERLKSIRKGKYTQAELAEILGVHETTIRRWESGRDDGPKEKMLSKIAAALNTTVAYLSGETDDPARSAPAEQPLPESNVRIADDDIVWVPVVSNNIKVCCGNGNDYGDIVWDVIGKYPILTSDLIGYSWQIRDGGVHIITVEGDSMEPKVNDGDRILIADVEVRDGDLAVCLYRGRTVLRGVSFEKGGIRLIPWNKEYSEIFVPEEDGEDLRFIGKMIGIVQLQIQPLSSMM